MFVAPGGMYQTRAGNDLVGNDPFKNNFVLRIDFTKKRMVHLSRIERRIENELVGDCRFACSLASFDHSDGDLFNDRRLIDFSARQLIIVQFLYFECVFCQISL